MLKLSPSASPELRAFAREVDTELQRLAGPQRPMKLWSVAKANLPPASDWTACAVYVSDQALIAVSNGTNWLKPDGTTV